MYRMRMLYSSLFVFFISFLVLFNTIHDYGQTYDEGFYLGTGEIYVKFFRTLDPEAIIRISPELPSWAVTAGSYLANLDWLLAGSDKTEKFHVAAVLSGALATTILYIFVLEITRNVAVGMFGAFSLLFYPQFFIHSHFNAKDIMHLAFYMLAVFCMYRYVKKKSWYWLILSSIVSGFSLSVKFNAVFLIPIALFSIAIVEKKITKILLRILLWGSIYSLSFFAFWPYLWYDTPKRIGEILLFFQNFNRGETAYFNAIYFSHHNIPWHYPFGMLLVLTPPFLLILIPVGILFVYRAINYQRNYALIVLIFWFFMRLLMFFIPSQSFAFDQIRHFLEILPTVPLFAALGLYQLYRISPQRIYRASIILFGCVVLMQQILINIQYHPYQTAYFNRLAGNSTYINTAFDIEYWGHVYKQASRELKGRFPRNSIFYTPSVFGWNLLEANKFPYTLTENTNGPFDYILIMNRKSLWYKEPYLVELLTTHTPIYTIERDGKIMLYVFKK